MSDAYEGIEKTLEKFGHLELTVKVVNINPKFNDKLLSKSEILSGYSLLVERVRYYQHKGYTKDTAVREAVKWGISQKLLGVYLIDNGAEVTGMLMTEFNIDIAKEVWQEEACEDLREEYEAALTAKYAELTAKDVELTAKDAELTAKDAEIEKLKTALEEAGKN